MELECFTLFDPDSLFLYLSSKFKNIQIKALYQNSKTFWYRARPKTAKSCFTVFIYSIIYTLYEGLILKGHINRSKHIFKWKSSDWNRAGKASHYVGFDRVSFLGWISNGTPLLLMLFTMILAKKQSSTVLDIICTRQ